MATKKITPESLQKQIDAYFEACGDDVFPDYAGMLLELDLLREEVADLCDGDDAASRKYYRIFARAKLRREMWAVRKAAKDSKLGSTLFNILKQDENGGYTSASAPNKTSEIRLVWDKAGGMDAFK